MTNKNDRADKVSALTIRLTHEVGPLSLYDPLADTTIPITVTDEQFTVTLRPGACALILLPEGIDIATPAETSENLALHKAVFGSSSAAEFWEDDCIGTHFLTDCVVENGYWTTAEGDRDGYLLIDLNKVETISRIELYGHSALGKRFSNNFTVSVSEDGVSFTEVAVVKNVKISDLAVPLTCSFDAIPARYIRIKLDTVRPGFGFGEIQVYA